MCKMSRLVVLVFFRSETPLDNYDRSPIKTIFIFFLQFSANKSLCDANSVQIDLGYILYRTVII